MNSKLKFLVLTLLMALGLFAATPASAQVQLLTLEQEVPMAATLDNPCTSQVEAIAFTGTSRIYQEVWLMPEGTTRLVLSEMSKMSGKDTLAVLAAPPVYTAKGWNYVDVEFAPGPVSLYNYKQVTSSAGTQDNFHTVISLDFDPGSLKITPGLSAVCDDGSPTPP